MSKHTINVTGVKTGVSPQSGPPPRRPIFDVVKDAKAFSLLVQGLVQMQQADQNQAASHFQISGIHGEPNIEWDGSGGSQSQSDDWGGYCHHGTVTFPTWHRPYVALYEQTLQAHIVSIASKYTTPDKAQWQDVAGKSRLPYWDWAATSVPPDEVINQSTVSVVVADGSTQDFPNPLYAYTFHPLADGQFDSPWDQWETTLRCPSDESPDAQTDVQQLINNLTGSGGTIAYQLKHSTYIMLTQLNQWLNMSNHSRDINPTYASSLEAIHDRIHSYVGGDNLGHMSAPPVAGHDPLFFLHHCNVDRLSALWQAIHYTSYVPRSTSEAGGWDYPANSEIDETSPLGPFWKDATSYWTSDGVRDFTQLGYTYPEFQGLDLSNKPAVRNAILAKVNTLYGTRFIRSGTNTLISTNAASPKAAPAPAPAPARAPAPAPAAQAPVAARNLPAASAAIADPSANAHNNLVDWRVHVLTPKNKLNGPYSILLFLGPVPDQESQFRNAETLIGSVEVFANIKVDRCGNCRTNSELIYEGFVYLNDALERSPIHQYDPHEVVSYLKKNLHWRVTQKGKEVDIRSRLPELKISVVEVPLHFSKGEPAPHRTGDVNHHPAVTSGRPGGT